MFFSGLSYNWDLKDPLEFVEIFQISLIILEFLDSTGTSLNPLEFSGICLNPFESPWIPLNPQKFPGIVNNQLESSESFGILAVEPLNFACVVFGLKF